MRIVVTGATGNIGTSLVRALADDPHVDHVVGLERRPPRWQLAGVSWQTADVTTDDLTPVLRDADAVVHLAWLIQPSRDVGKLWDVNVRGSRRLLAAASAADVGVIVHASSIGAYSPGPAGGDPVDESWPTDGVGTSSYSRAKAYVERCLDAFEERHPATRVVRVRPALVFKREAGDRVRRLFLGSLFPPSSLGRLPALPAVRGVSFQAVHAADVADALRSALLTDVSGAFNLAGEPVLTFDDVAEAIDARTVPVPPALVRPVVAATWAARLQPLDVGWFDLARTAPTMDSTRARRDLGWRPAHSASEALEELLMGVGLRIGGPTAPLSSDHPRVAELTARQGASETRP